MHQALLISELQVLVFLECRNYSLATLARTCRSFHDNALDRLWHHVDFLNLMRVLPTDLWTYTPTTPNSPGWPRPQFSLNTFQRPIIASADLGSFNMYAKRVVSVTYYLGSLAASAVEMLRHQMPMPMLSNLRTISCSVYRGPRWLEEQDSLLMSLLLTPKIESIKITSLALGQSGLALLSDIGRSVTSLRSFELLVESRFPDRGLSQAVSNLISQTTQLEHLEIDCLSAHAMAHITASTKLQHLIIRSLKDMVFEPRPESNTTNITSLKLFTNECALTLHKFISHIRPSQLQKLTLVTEELQSSLSSERWQQCFLTISLYCQSTLQQLLISKTLSFQFVHMFEWETFEPLLSLRRLRVLHILGFHCAFGDGELERMAQSWPELEEFSFQSPVINMISHSRITLTGLVSLLKHCSNLSSLSLTIDARTVDQKLVDDPQQTVCNRNITQIEMGYSPIEDPIAVANFLYKILPDLRDITTWYSHISPTAHNADEARLYDSRWGTVMKTIDSIAAGDA